MATAYGTLSVSDLLAATGQTVADFGEDRAFAAIQDGLDAHNGIVRDMIGDLAAVTSERLSRYGSNAGGDMVEVDEYGSPDAQKIAAGSTVGWPLRKQEFAVQWTRTYMRIATPAELAAQFTAARDADLRRIQRDIARAVFTPTNNLTYVDALYDKATLPIRAFLNADGSGVPYGISGITFDGSTHTHYLGTASLVAANVSALIETVLEHGGGAGLRLYINRAQEAAIRGMANFTGYVDARINPADTSTVAVGALNVNSLYNRAIGVFDAAEVWVKPWVPASYLAVFDVAVPQKPLRVRTRSGTLDGLGALGIEAEHDHYPLRANVLSREYGIAPWNRWNGAALYTGNATYAAPTIN